MLSLLIFKPFGKQAILIEWASKIDEVILQDMISFKEKISKNSVNKITDIIVGYHSLTLKYNREITHFSEEIVRLKKRYQEISVSTGVTGLTNYIWEIPVCYDASFGIDLADISVKKNIPINQIIQLHTQPIYTVYFIGFLPGFLYLGGLNTQLHTARKSTPRLVVEKGAVGIGGSQTGIYPSKSAGGWNLIGKTPIPFFNVAKENPCFAKSGDGIQFVAVSLEEYIEIEKQVQENKYSIQKRVRND